LTKSDIEKLQKTKSFKKLKNPITKRLGNSKSLHTNDWDEQGDIDSILLKDRIKYCSNIRSDVKEIFHSSFVASKMV
jgi:hypothetical protein